MNLYENIKNRLNEDEDWENSPEWTDKEVIANMPGFNRGINKILDDLYANGNVTYYNYLEATLEFNSYAEDEEYTTPTDYSKLKEELISCANKNNFVIDEQTFLAEVIDVNGFDPDLAVWEVRFNFKLME